MDLANALAELGEESVDVGLIAVDDVLGCNSELSDGAPELIGQAIEEVVCNLDGVAVKDVLDGDGRIDGDAVIALAADVVGRSDLVTVGDVRNMDRHFSVEDVTAQDPVAVGDVVKIDCT